MRLDRLISILTVLLKRDRVSARELSEMFGVSVRTILRDIDALDLAGIPIVTYQGTGGGISIAEGYKLGKSILTCDDVAAIISALAGFSRTMHDARHDVLLEKFKNIVPPSQSGRLAAKTGQLIIDLAPWGGNDYLKDRLSLIRSAIDEDRVIEFSYTDSNMSRSVRRAEPCSLVLKGQSWYMYAYCLLREQPRLFRLSRMKDLKMLDDKFTPRVHAVDSLTWEEEWGHPKNMTEIVLLFDNEMETVAREAFGDNIESCPDGRFVVRANFPVNNWLYGFILSFGPGVEVLRPKYLRDIIRDAAEGIRNRYAE
jgi:predicted DNA-binding transcriptional regulator YafY